MSHTLRSALEVSGADRQPCHPPDPLLPVAPEPEASTDAQPSPVALEVAGGALSRPARGAKGRLPPLRAARLRDDAFRGSRLFLPSLMQLFTGAAGRL